MIRGAVREAGDRAKVAVFSRERDVDPVGACVGMRGTRVQAIIRELRGEKIDIVEWSEDPVQFVTKALSPARVQRVEHRRRRAARDGSRRRGPAAVARDRQEGPERPARGEADGLEDRHQERRREAQGSRAAAGRHRVRRRRRRGARRSTLPDIHDEVLAALRAGGFDTVEKVLEAEPDEPGRAARLRSGHGGRRRRRRANASRRDSSAGRSEAAASEGRSRAPTSRRSEPTRRRASGRVDELAQGLTGSPVEVSQGASLATVRIYKVAELLGLSSQDAIDLLKKETGIDVKSASSSIEEIVARQFVERQAQQAPDRAAAWPALRRRAAPPRSRRARPARRPSRRSRRRPCCARGSSRHSVRPRRRAEAPVEAAGARPRSTSRRRASAVEPDAGRRGRAPAVDPGAERRAARRARSRGRRRRPSSSAAARRSRAGGAAGAAAACRPRTSRRASGRPARAADAASAHRRSASPAKRRRRGRCRSARSSGRSRRRRRRRVRPSRRRRAPSGLARCGRRMPAARPPLGGPRPLPSQPIRPAAPGGAPSPARRSRRVRHFISALPGRGRGRSAATSGRSSRPCQEAPPPITKLITLAEGMTVKDLADKLEVKVKDVLKKLIDRRMMMTINSTLDAETAQMIARDFGAEVLIRSFEEELTEVETEASKPGGPRRRARRSSPSWVTSTTARRRCSTRSARRRSPSAKPAASRSTSARIRSTSAAAASCSSTRPVTKRSR